MELSKSASGLFASRHSHVLEYIAMPTAKTPAAAAYLARFPLQTSFRHDQALRDMLWELTHAWRCHQNEALRRCVLEAHARVVAAARDKAARQ